jgi:transcriptional regulator with XRE-family HTH domain
MSPRKVGPATPTADSLADRIAIQLGIELREARIRRGWTLPQVARRARVTDATVQRLEAGARGSLGTYARLATALGLDPTFSMSTPRRGGVVRDADAVHAAMGESEAAHFRERGRDVLLDEPYQHYQFAGRADVLAIDRSRRDLLHIENRTRFPDLQAFAGTYNAKRAYLASDLARRLGIPGGFRTVTHVVAGLWSSEVLHVVRLRRASFASVCPDPAHTFAAWCDGDGEVTASMSTFILFDPMRGRRSTRRRWVGLDAIDRVDPRYRGYAHALEQLRRDGRA